MVSWLSLLTERIHQCNPILASKFQDWLWPSGTCFLDQRLWWGEGKERLAPHEGIDLVWYVDQQGERRPLAPGLLIPTIFPGQLVHLHRDFLHWSVYIRHEQFCRDGAVLYTVYGHVQPEETLNIDQEIRAGTPVAVLTAYPRSTVPLHLHFTVAWIPNDFFPSQLNWQTLSENKQIVLLDPLADCALAGEYTTVRV